MTLRRGRIWSQRPSSLAVSRTSPNAFAEFYEDASPTILRFFLGQTRDTQRALDLTAETFSKAFEQRGSFRGTTDEQAHAWLWAIARNELARSHRVSKVEFAAAARLKLERPSPNDAELREIEDLMAIHAAREHLRQALRLLSPEQREVLTLRFVEELGYPEIAERLGVRADVVRARTSRALRALRTIDQVHEAVHALEA